MQSERDLHVLDFIFGPPCAVPAAQAAQAAPFVADTVPRQPHHDIEAEAVRLAEGGDADMAEELLTKAIEEFPNEPSLLNNRFLFEKIRFIFLRDMFSKLFAWKKLPSNISRAQVRRIKGERGASMEDLNKCLGLLEGVGETASLLITKRQAHTQRGILRKCEC